MKKNEHWRSFIVGGRISVVATNRLTIRHKVRPRPRTSQLRQWVVMVLLEPDDMTSNPYESLWVDIRRYIN